MTRTWLAAAALLAAACNTKPTWTPYSAGPVSMEFPCKPERSSAVTKCMRSDGTVYALAVVDKAIDPDQELKDISEYAKTLPKSELISEGRYPLRWREVRQFRQLDSWLYFRDGKEYTATVDYATEKLPETGAEFFSRRRIQE